MAQINEGILFGVGNPLLDIQAKVSKEFLEKWELKENDAILCDDNLVPLFDDMITTYKDKLEYVAGGSTQNSIRVAQWMLQRPKATTFTGCVGQDKYGGILKDKAIEAGVNVIYQIHPTEKTGTCAVCVYKMSRSLCAHLAAANCFTKDHLDLPEIAKLIEKAQYYYIAGFHLTVCPEAIQHVAQHACQKNKYFCMNLSAPFISEIFKEPQMAAMPYVDIIFGNDVEAKAFAEAQNIQYETNQELALKMAALPKKNTSRPRMAVVTQGPGTVIVAFENKIREFPVPELKPEDVVDTNGAGDAFVGGFLSQFVQGKPIEKAVDAGTWAAQLIIRRSGCTYPEKCDYV